MFVPVFTIKFLALLSFLFVIVSGNPIKRSEDEGTGVRLPGLFGLFTTLAASALTTGEQVSFGILFLPHLILTFSSHTALPPISLDNTPNPAFTCSIQEEHLY